MYKGIRALLKRFSSTPFFIKIIFSVIMRCMVFAAEKQFLNALKINPAHIQSTVNRSSILIRKTRYRDAVVFIKTFPEIKNGSDDEHSSKYTHIQFFASLKSEKLSNIFKNEQKENLDINGDLFEKLNVPDQR